MSKLPNRETLEGGAGNSCITKLPSRETGHIICKAQKKETTAQQEENIWEHTLYCGAVEQKRKLPSFPPGHPYSYYGAPICSRILSHVLVTLKELNEQNTCPSKSALGEKFQHELQARCDGTVHTTLQTCFLHIETDAAMPSVRLLHGTGFKTTLARVSWFGWGVGKKKHNNDKRRRGGTYREWWCKLHVLAPMHQESQPPYLLPPSLPASLLPVLSTLSASRVRVRQLLRKSSEPTSKILLRKWVWRLVVESEHRNRLAKAPKRARKNSNQSAFAPKSPDRPFLQP